MLYIFSLGILNGMPFFCLRRIYLNPMKEGSELKHTYIYILYMFTLYICVLQIHVSYVYIYIYTFKYIHTKVFILNNFGSIMTRIYSKIRNLKGMCFSV